MKVNFKAPLASIDGKPLLKKTMDGETPQTVQLTLKDAAIEALMFELDNEHATGQDKLKRALLAERIFREEDLEIEPEEAALLKERIGRGYGAAVVYATFKLLNG